MVMALIVRTVVRVLQRVRWRAMRQVCVNLCRDGPVVSLLPWTMRLAFGVFGVGERERAHVPRLSLLRGQPRD